MPGLWSGERNRLSPTFGSEGDPRYALPTRAVRIKLRDAISTSNLVQQFLGLIQHRTDIVGIVYSAASVVGDVLGEEPNPLDRIGYRRLTVGIRSAFGRVIPCGGIAESGADVVKS